ncbi:hypothetical protein Baya_1599 [Bagarius yarrelli]|uniref:Ig-like domain-containing protein n=1 Tax=Bagarius yarrelli TaxID=175774 RepID=A0A556TLJ1_BAGYA|nr:hypothetical protein Baya_1599 [Bagarius yarrelli]
MERPVGLVLLGAGRRRVPSNADIECYLLNHKESLFYERMPEGKTSSAGGQALETTTELHGWDRQTGFTCSVNSCTKKVSDKVGEKCFLVAASGFYRCVTALDSGFLHPFKPSPNTVTSYIIITASQDMTNESEKSSLVQLTEGEFVLLNCSFAPEIDSTDFTVYWIKTTETSSDCLYSYEFSYHHIIQFNQQRNVQEELLYRISNQTEGRNTHNIRISNLTGSDTGQYLCALHGNSKQETKGTWRIINHVTVDVYSKEHEILKNRTDDKESERAGINTDFIPLYATIPILLALTIAAVVFIWKKVQTTPVTNESEKSSLVQLTEGEFVLLNCSFAPEIDSTDFTVYWIKTTETSSDCLYSYEFSHHHMIQFNQQRNVQEELLYRISNQTEGRNTHNIRISNLTGSDTGQYLCALHGNREQETKGTWRIINNVTVDVYSKEHEILKNRTDDKESERAGINTESNMVKKLILNSSITTS